MAFNSERKQIRLANYSYSVRGAYFITICTAGRKPILSRVIAGDLVHGPELRLSAVGREVHENIPKISAAYPGITVDKYVIMPNHVHLLVQIRSDTSDTPESRDKMLIPKAVQSFKASVSRRVPHFFRPIWQSRYFDRVVRDEEEYLRIWKYIDDNPAAWLDDDYYVGD